jgi:hypothetical protein
VIEADNLPLSTAPVMKSSYEGGFRTKGALSTYMLNALGSSGSSNRRAHRSSGSPAPFKPIAQASTARSAAVTVSLTAVWDP